jgi:hypothetical protein
VLLRDTNESLPAPFNVLLQLIEQQRQWEESMAESAVQHVARHKGRIAVLAGVAHLAHRDG